MNARPTLAREQSELVYDAAAVARVMAGSCRLMRGEINPEQWLEKLAVMAEADGAAVCSWHTGKVQECRAHAYGTAIPLHSLQRTVIDTALAAHPPTAPQFVDHTLRAAGPGTLAAHDPALDRGRRLSLLVDWEPARSVVCLTRSSNSPAFTPQERASFLALGPHFRESCLLHKHVDGLIDIARISNAIFNSSPRGMMLLKPDGSVPVANFKAQQLTTRDDGIAVRNGQLQISDPDVMHELMEVLQQLDSMPRDKFHELRWFWSVAGKQRDVPYQLALQVILLPNGNIESRFSDRVALLFVNDPTSVSRPTEAELRQYYGLTGAQARVALALWGGLSIKDAAHKLSISVHTARSHLRSIYATTGTHSHAELMSVLTATLVRHHGTVDPTAPGRPG
jgi:DNA-binding CsgD family transcriptional regulator